MQGGLQNIFGFIVSRLKFKLRIFSIIIIIQFDCLPRENSNSVTNKKRYSSLCRRRMLSEAIDNLNGSMGSTSCHP